MHGTFYWVGDNCIALHLADDWRGWIGWGRARTASSGGAVYALWIGRLMLSFTTHR